MRREDLRRRGLWRDSALLEQARARRRAYSGEELAEVVGDEGGATAIAGAIRNFRNRAKRALLVEASISIDPSTDLILIAIGFRKRPSW